MTAYALTAQTTTYPLPFHETFQLVSPSLDDWTFDNNSNPIVVHNPDVGAYAADSGCLMYNLFNPGANNYDVISPVFTSNHKGGFKVSFDFAAAVRNNGPIMLPQNYAIDVLRIQSSRDSGNFYNYQTEYLIVDTGALNTGGVKPNPYTPLEQEWVTISDVKLPRALIELIFTSSEQISLAQAIWHI